ncbi:MAG: 4-hydroxy-3-methylbut-2-enyl diphosphate reductase [Treponema sp.]|jgi:4-hydroxy-3-methylbut-2-enyl diphosphate reductase|nr:4-hydroxy-3-methylbut-2-enyl diphosphate reductase [Treponema sp.]
MNLIKAEVLGYCMGVRRAVTMAEEAVKAAAGVQRVFTLGPLIHNPQVLEQFRSQGLEVLNETELPEDLASAVVIIRAHGIIPQLESILSYKGACLVDATCPRVKKSQMKARFLTDAGYCIFLAGERYHGEVIGIQGYAPACFVVADPVEAKERAETLYHNVPTAKTALLGQTTIAPEEYQGIAQAIQAYFPHLEIIDTICKATRDRQHALSQLCPQVDALLILGGKESANTRRLLAIAQAQGKQAWLVETVAEIPPEISAYPVVGLATGASTPDEFVDQIAKALSSAQAAEPMGRENL